MLESRLKARLKAKLKPRRKTFNLREIENIVHEGDPDLYYCNRGMRQGWIELKCSQRSPLLSKGLRDSQVERINELTNFLVPVWILVAVKDEVFLLAGIYAESLNDMLLKHLRDEAAIKGKFNSKRFWAQLIDFLDR